MPLRRDLFLPSISRRLFLAAKPLRRAIILALTEEQTKTALLLLTDLRFEVQTSVVHVSQMSKSYGLVCCFGLF